MNYISKPSHNPTELLYSRGRCCHRPHKLGKSRVFTTHTLTMDVTHLNLLLKKVVGDNTDHGSKRMNYISKPCHNPTELLFIIQKE